MELEGYTRFEIGQHILVINDDTDRLNPRRTKLPCMKVNGSMCSITKSVIIMPGHPGYILSSFSPEFGYMWTNTEVVYAKTNEDGNCFDFGKPESVIQKNIDACQRRL